MNIFLILIFTCILNGCTIGPRIESETILIRPGTPMAIIDESELKIVEMSNGQVKVLDKNKVKVIVEGKVSKANLQGLMVVDGPTLDYYKNLHELYGKDFFKRKANGQ